jgi:hypothetical protein
VTDWVTPKPAPELATGPAIFMPCSDPSAPGAKLRESRSIHRRSCPDPYCPGCSYDVVSALGIVRGEITSRAYTARLDRTFQKVL